MGSINNLTLDQRRVIIFGIFKKLSKDDFEKMKTVMKNNEEYNNNNITSEITNKMQLLNIMEDHKLFTLENIETLVKVLNEINKKELSEDLRKY